MPDNQALLRKIEREHIDQFNVPDEVQAFDLSDLTKPPITTPLKVMAWLADEDCDISSFATVGMAVQEIPGADYRTELHFDIRGGISAEDVQTLCEFLAELATLPLETGQALNWWDMVQSEGGIPLFPSCTALLFHPRFFPDGWDTIECDGTRVKILNLVPITEKEARLESGQAIMRQIESKRIDILSPR